MIAYIALAATVIGAVADLATILKYVRPTRAAQRPTVEGRLPASARPSGVLREHPRLALLIAALTAATIGLAVLTYVIWPPPTYLRIVSITSPVKAGATARNARENRPLKNAQPRQGTLEQAVSKAPSARPMRPWERLLQRPEALPL